MTKADVIESVCKEVGFSKKESAEIVEMVFDTIKDTLEKGEKIKLSRDQRAARADLPPLAGAEERAEYLERRLSASLKSAAPPYRRRLAPVRVDGARGG